MQIIYRRVQNYAKARQGLHPEAIVIHMADDDAESCLDKYNNPLLRNSAHYLITRGGQIWRLVEETDTAWHAGGVQKPTWGQIKTGTNPNLYTIGIAHEGKPGDTWTDDMYHSSAQLIANICSRWNIPLDREHVIGHSEINSLHHDPGLAVDFARLIRQAGSVYQDDQDGVTDQETHTEASLRNRLSNLQLNTAGLETENRKLKQELEAREPEKLTKLQNQTSTMSEELYTSQQKIHQLQSKYDTLLLRYTELKSEHAGYLSQFPIRELISAIIKRIRHK